MYGVTAIANMTVPIIPFGDPLTDNVTAGAAIFQGPEFPKKRQYI